jgi:DNA-binding protein HU-beta
MTKTELVETVLKNTKLPMTKKAANAFVDAVFTGVAKAVKKGSRFHFPGFGTFQIRTRKARTGRHPQTGAAIKIKASKTVAFKPSKEFKESL